MAFRLITQPGPGPSPEVVELLLSPVLAPYFAPLDVAALVANQPLLASLRANRTLASFLCSHPPLLEAFLADPPPLPFGNAYPLLRDPSGHTSDACAAAPPGHFPEPNWWLHVDGYRLGLRLGLPQPPSHQELLAQQMAVLESWETEEDLRRALAAGQEEQDAGEPRSAVAPLR